MKKLFQTTILGVLLLTLAACEEDPEDDDPQTGPGEDNGASSPIEHEVDQEALDNLTTILETLDDTYSEWEGKMLVNTVTVQDPASLSEEETVDIQTRVHIDASGDRLYVETLNMSSEDTSQPLNYLYIENGTAYSFESADFKSGEDSEDTYETLDKEDIEGNVPRIDDMFAQTLQFFPSDKEQAEMQGMTLTDASIHYDEADDTYSADVFVLMETQTGEQNEEVWSIEGGPEEATIEMPIPSLGTVTFRDVDFDEVVDPIDKSLHPSQSDGDKEDGND